MKKQCSEIITDTAHTFLKTDFAQHFNGYKVHKTIIIKYNLYIQTIIQDQTHRNKYHRPVLHRVRLAELGASTLTHAPTEALLEAILEKKELHYH